MPPLDELSHDELMRLAVTQYQLIVDLQTANKKLEASNAKLAARVAQLERQISRNSGNSSNPPSADDIVGRIPPAPRKRNGSGRRQGKQPGAPGSGLAWREEPDEKVAHYRTGRCECGQDLAAAQDLGVERSQQVHEVPLVTVKVTQHDMHLTGCACGRKHLASAPAELAGAPVCYGTNLQALVVYLLVFQHVPVARCAQLIADLTGAQPSTGYVHSIFTRAAGRLAEVVEQIKTEIIFSHIVGFDETTLRTGAAGRKRHVLAATTDLHTLFGLGGRDLGSFDAFGVLGPFTGIAVHDRYSLYDNERFTPLAGHQLCCAHLIRDLADAGESYPEQTWPADVTTVISALIGQARQARANGLPAIPPAIRRRLTGKYTTAVQTGLDTISRVPGGSTVKQPPGRLLLECLRDRQSDVLRFTTDIAIPPTNNSSERSLRPLKTQQKISGRLPSETTTRHRLTIRSYLDTAAKHGVNMMTALRIAMLGDPWTLPAAVPA